MSDDLDPIQLEPARGILPRADRRPRVPEPPPVRLVAVETVHLPAPAGLERELDAFYVGLLRLKRDEGVPERLIYHAENVSLHFDIVEGLIERQTVRPLGIEIALLGEIENALIGREIEFAKQKGLVPGQKSLLFLDPAGNWVEVTELRPL